MSVWAGGEARDGWVATPPAPATLAHRTQNPLQYPMKPARHTTTKEGTPWEEDDDYEAVVAAAPKATFPDMTDRQNVRFDSGSGLIVAT